MFLVLFYSFWFLTHAASHGRCGARARAGRRAAARPSDRCRRTLASSLDTRAHQYLTGRTSVPFQGPSHSPLSHAIPPSCKITSDQYCRCRFRLSAFMGFLATSPAPMAR
eukprot:16657-Pleurochrysis_carterae.AAC.1